MKTNTALTIVSAMAVATSCIATRAGDTQPADGKALFSHAVYSGHDSIYERNPLPDGQSYHNPILPGWYSDPTVCTNGRSDYWLAASTFAYWPGVPVFHSRDMVNWKQVGNILDRESQLKNMEHQHVSGGIFAPDLKYCAANDTYYMITTNVGAGNFFVKAKNPAGPWSDAIYLPEVNGIDPSFLFDNDGRAYIVHNDDAPDNKPEYSGHRTIRLVEFDIQGDSCKGESIILVDKGCRPEEKPIWCEGPHIYHIGDMYYLITAEGGTAGNHSEVVYRSKNVKGPYKPWEKNPILTQRNLDPKRTDPVTCAGHADMIQTRDGKWWAVFLACRPNEKGYENLGRETFMLPVEWTEDGWPVILPDGEPVPTVVSCPGLEVSDTPTFGNFTVETQEFPADSLPHEWLTLRGPATSHYSLAERPGWLAIECAPVSLSEKETLPYVGRRIQHSDFDFEMRMVFEPKDTLEHAGLAVMKDETHQYQLAKRLGKKGIEIALSRVDENPCPTLLASAPLKENGAIDLRISGSPLAFAFSYSTDGGKTWETLAEGVDARHTSTAAAGGFTGTTIGAFASSKPNR